jgi:alkaline phosphatase D
MVPDSLAFKLQGRQVPTFSGGTFPDGISAGDPTPNAITLWTRVAGVGGTGSVGLEIATSKSFSASSVVSNTLVPADPDKLFTVKARITGLSPYAQYYYRFYTKSGNSAVGKFRTAPPADSNQPIKFAFFTCQMYEYGYFNAHALMAKEDVDFVLNLGDFIYETALDMPIAVRRTGFKGSTVFSGPVSYADYCQRYQAYRADKDLKANLAAHAMISTWDDHEVMNNYAGGTGADGGDAARSKPNSNPAFSYVGWSEDRKINAYKAWFDNMPTFPQDTGGYKLYHKAGFGKNLDLWVLDERQYRAAQPCGHLATNIDPASCTELANPRDFLGSDQMSWLQGGLAASGAKWKVIANEVVIMPTKTPSGNLGSNDDWTAYPGERESLLSAIRTGGISNVVFATGDYHTFMAG